MRLSKLDAARRQLDVAAELFVVGDDRLAVHTLSGAAEEILGALLKRSGQEATLERMQIAAEMRLERKLDRKEYLALVNRSRNALKHASDSNEDTFEYDPNHAAGMLFRAMMNYQTLTDRLTEPMERALVLLRKEYASFFPSE